MNSLRRFLIQEVLAKQQSAALDRPSAEDMTDEIEINRQWNSEIAKMREKRILETKETRREHILTSLEKQKEIKNQRLTMLNEKVKRIEKETKSFITRDALDISIEHALANPISFDYYIDSKGNANASFKQVKENDSTDQAQTTEKLK